MKKTHQGSCVAQSVKRLTLGFGSGHDLTVRGLESGMESRMEPHIHSVEPAWDSLSAPSLLSLSLSFSLSLSLPLRINKLFQKWRKLTKSYFWGVGPGK